MQMMSVRKKKKLEHNCLRGSGKCAVAEDNVQKLMRRQFIRMLNEARREKHEKIHNL